MKNAILTSMDAAGRLVIPKSMRQALGLSRKTKLQVSIDDAALRIELAPLPVIIRKRGRVAVLTPKKAVVPLTTDMVNETLAAVREKR